MMKAERHRSENPHKYPRQWALPPEIDALHGMSAMCHCLTLAPASRGPAPGRGAAPDIRPHCHHTAAVCTSAAARRDRRHLGGAGHRAGAVARSQRAAEQRQIFSMIFGVGVCISARLQPARTRRAFAIGLVAILVCCARVPRRRDYSIRACAIRGARRASEALVLQRRTEHRPLNLEPSIIRF